MMKGAFRQHVRGAPKKFEWQKRKDFEYERTKTVVKITDIPRVTEFSHLTGETRKPHWVINIYARRDADCKTPLISSTQSISGSQLGEAFACMILDLHAKLNYDPCALSHAIHTAVCEAWKRQTKEK